MQQVQNIQGSLCAKSHTHGISDSGDWLVAQLLTRLPHMVDKAVCLPLHCTFDRCGNVADPHCPKKRSTPCRAIVNKASFDDRRGVQQRDRAAVRDISVDRPTHVAAAGRRLAEVRETYTIRSNISG